MIIVQAKDSEFSEIMALYRGALGEEGCTWDESYPTSDIIREDITSGNMYCMKTESGEIIASAAIAQDSDLANIACFSTKLEPSIELMRLVVAKGYQNRGLAREMLCFLMELARETGYRSVRFLVGRYNERAVRSYSKLGFPSLARSICSTKTGIVMKRTCPPIEGREVSDEPTKRCMRSRINTSELCYPVFEGGYSNGFACKSEQCLTVY
jgi:ribosomal protein S18 acetylase RimI-like enzyme